MNIDEEKNQALSVLKSSMIKLSIIYKECFLSKGKGALLVYASSVIDNIIPSAIDYNTKKEILDIFEEPHSQAKICKMIDGYDPREEGVMVLITSHSNASFFITIKFKQS